LLHSPSLTRLNGNHHVMIWKPCIMDDKFGLLKRIAAITEGVDAMLRQLTDQEEELHRLTIRVANLAESTRRVQREASSRYVSLSMENHTRASLLCDEVHASIMRPVSQDA
jgi:hypothetical protein